ncbi:MAG: hypothetical protein RMK64_11595 [Rhodovarius sp.]|nr:hypothetical protein [Rhodovarius sp.]
MLRHPSRRVQKRGDQHIREIVRALPQFDWVNIQLEYGIFGLTSERILRRLGWILDAAPAVSVAFHTMLDAGELPWREARAALTRLRPDRAALLLLGAVRDQALGWRFYRRLRWTALRKPVRLIAHNRRDARLLRELHGFRHVFDHPLSFVSVAEAARIRATARREDFPIIRHLPPEAKLIGTFGFLSAYKGFEVAIRALRLLPPHYHLLIFGGVHPQTIRRDQLIDPYVRQLLREGRLGQSLLELLAYEAPEAVRATRDPSGLFASPPGDLTERVHFMGVLDDDGFARAMAICDAVAMPYVEVGQTSSGAIALALDMGCRVIASRTKTFLALNRYFPGEIEFFDIGNHVELAQHLAAPPPFERAGRELPFNTTTNAATYVKAHSKQRRLFAPSTA